MLEVLAAAGALTDLAPRARRIVEPDPRVVDRACSTPAPGRASQRAHERSRSRASRAGAPFVVASAETLAYAVATGARGRPAGFKRPVRVTMPRALPTDDVLILRDKKGIESTAKKAPALPAATAWRGPLTLDVHLGVPSIASRKALSNGATSEGIVLVLSTLDEVRATVEGAADLASVRAVVAPFMPSTAVTALASEGIAAFTH